MNAAALDAGSASAGTRLRLCVGHLARGLVGLLLILVVLLMFANVVARHVFSASFYWAEEVAVYLNVWCVFLGVALVTRANGHLRMDLLLHALPARYKRSLNMAAWLTTLLVSAVIVGCSASLLVQLWQAELRSVAVGLPMVVPHLAVFVGFLATFLVALFNRRLFLEGHSEKLELDDPSDEDAEARP